MPAYPYFGTLNIYALIATAPITVVGGIGRKRPAPTAQAFFPGFQSNAQPLPYKTRYHRGRAPIQLKISAAGPHPAISFIPQPGGADTNIRSYDDAFLLSGGYAVYFQWACGAGLIHGTAAHTLAPRSRCV